MAEQCSGLGGDSKELMHSHPLRVDIDARNLEVLGCCVQKDVEIFPDVGVMVLIFRQKKKVLPIQLPP